MIGTIGMYADQQITNSNVGPRTGSPSALATRITDPTLDVGADFQYQWIGDEHAVTVRGLYVWQTKKNNIENSFSAGANASDELNDLNVSASYIYDRTISFTAGYFNTLGNKDINLYGTPTVHRTPADGT